MGYFSWNCKVCGRSILCPDGLTPKNSWRNRGVAVLAAGGILKGAYDGLGCLDGATIPGRRATNPDLYHEACWKAASEPMTHQGGSSFANDQGDCYNQAGLEVDPPVTPKERLLAALARIRAADPEAIRFDGVPAFTVGETAALAEVVAEFCEFR